MRQKRAFDFSTIKGRDYFYSSKEWRTIRQSILLRDPLCVHCLKDNVIEPSTDCDHIIDLVDAPHLALDPSNLQGLCKVCHSRKTYMKNRSDREPFHPYDYKPKKNLENPFFK